MGMIIAIVIGLLGLLFLVGGIQGIRDKDDSGIKMLLSGIGVICLSALLFFVSSLPPDKPSLTDYHTWCYDNGYESDNSDYYDAIGE